MAELSVRYAKALFDLSMERGLLNEYLEQAAFLKDMLESENLMGIIRHPAISTAEKRGILSDALRGKIHDDLLGFLYLVIDKNRESFLIPALTEFIATGESYNRKTTANVVSAAELGQHQLAALKDMLSKKLNKQVEIQSQVDPSVLGGFYIHVDGYLIDRTVRKQLSDMKYAIKRSCAE